MKKTLLFTLALMLGLIMSACSSTSADESEKTDQETEDEQNEQEESLLPEDYGENTREDAEENAASEYLKASIEYIDSSFGKELLLDNVDKAEKVNTGEEANQNKIDVEITLNDNFKNDSKGLVLPHAILMDLVDNKFNEFANSEVNEVHFVVNAPIDGEATKVYEVAIDEEGYNKIHNQDSDEIGLDRIFDNTEEYWTHDIYKEDNFNYDSIQKEIE